MKNTLRLVRPVIHNTFSDPTLPDVHLSQWVVVNSQQRWKCQQQVQDVEPNASKS